MYAMETNAKVVLFALILFSLSLNGRAAKPRNVRIAGTHFIDRNTNTPIVLGGPNVVVKGPPYLPNVSGDTVCNDIVDKYCSGKGNCSTCTTFNQADVDHIKARGWNFIRLGVVWAGAQTRDGRNSTQIFWNVCTFLT